ncbi:hypothetical protein L1286_15060 [Pseudoalteromonas sp. SMS1]|uniref:hypothetical protein n=1 Tax=Pseudoalteromonas sp. SMS1 TaxID=2908894 RepID=UPI001F1F3619|nr:hypothetical protein [Pseudoalteromonas sp. SMS1]MCF2858804.1 hypothetical protein [Pseudoalteromonas sp. SMS1]
MVEHLEEFKYLWEDISGGWGLLHVNADRKQEAPDYLVVNISNKNVVLIEDDVVAKKVIEKMLSNGPRIVAIGNGF